MDTVSTPVMTPMRNTSPLAPRSALLAACLVQLLLAAPAVPSPPPGVSLIEGRSAPFFHNRPVSAFRVYAFHDDRPQPVPFQIDERDERDRWILNHGPKAKHDSPAGMFDANDAIVVMNRDLGQRGDPSVLPDRASHWAEVRVGAETNPLGFVYVGVFPPAQAPQFVTRPYARYDPATDRVYAERYALAFDAPLPTHFAPVERLGDFGTNTIAGIKAAADVRLLGGLLSFQRTHADLRSTLRSYQPGPVRAIRQARYRVPLPFGLRTSGKVNLIFYRDFVEGSALIKIKIPPRLVLADGEFRAYFDFLNLGGARLLLNGAPLGEAVNGSMTAAKRALNGRPARWAALLLPSGRTIVFIPRLGGALAKLDQRAYYAENTADHGLPHFGFQFYEIKRLESGAHRLSVFGLLLDSVDPDTVRRAAEIFLSPPQVEVRLVNAPLD